MDTSRLLLGDPLEGRGAADPALENDLQQRMNVP